MNIVTLTLIPLLRPSRSLLALWTGYPWPAPRSLPVQTCLQLPSAKQQSDKEYYTCT